MIDICTCCNGCTSTRQLSSSPRYGFPKKLLVAISLVVIITMCLPPTEARSIENKRRHRRPDGMTQPTKEIRTEAHEHKRRHHKLEITPTKEMLRRPKNPQADIFNHETRKIVNKLKNTRRFFMDERRQLNELKEYRDSMPRWLPTVNFVDIHFHDYRSNRSRRNGTTIPERKFTYVIPKLYKSLVEYEEIFKRLLRVELNFPDDPYNTYKLRRKEVLQSTLYRLHSTIQVLKDSMAAVKLTLPTFNKNKLDLSSLDTKVDATLCIKNDYLAVRGYGNLLNNWYLQFRCKSAKQASKEICRKYIKKLMKRKSNNESS